MQARRLPSLHPAGPPGPGPFGVRRPVRDREVAPSGVGVVLRVDNSVTATSETPRGRRPTPAEGEASRRERGAERRRRRRRWNPAPTRRDNRATGLPAISPGRAGGVRGPRRAPNALLLALRRAPTRGGTRVRGRWRDSFQPNSISPYCRCARGSARCRGSVRGNRGTSGKAVSKAAAAPAATPSLRRRDGRSRGHRRLDRRLVRQPLGGRVLGSRGPGHHDAWFTNS